MSFNRRVTLKKILHTYYYYYYYERNKSSIFLIWFLPGINISRWVVS